MQKGKYDKPGFKSIVGGYLTDAPDKTRNKYLLLLGEKSQNVVDWEFSLFDPSKKKFTIFTAVENAVRGGNANG